MQSLRAQGKDGQADMVAKRFRRSWEQADIRLTASRFMGKPPSTVAAVSIDQPTALLRSK